MADVGEAREMGRCGKSEGDGQMWEKRGRWAREARETGIQFDATEMQSAKIINYTVYTLF